MRFITSDLRWRSQRVFTPGLEVVGFEDTVKIGLRYLKKTNKPKSTSNQNAWQSGPKEELDVGQLVSMMRVLARSQEGLREQC